MQKFLWQGKRPRMALQKLYPSKVEGGKGLANIRVYSLACYYGMSQTGSKVHPNIPNR